MATNNNEAAASGPPVSDGVYVVRHRNGTECICKVTSRGKRLDYFVGTFGGVQHYLMESEIELHRPHVPLVPAPPERCSTCSGTGSIEKTPAIPQWSEHGGREQEPCPDCMHPTPPAEGAASLKELTILRDYIGLAEGERAIAFERGRLIVDGPGGRRDARMLLNSVDLAQLRSAGMPDDAEPGEWVKKLVNKINLQAAEIAGLKGTISGMQCGVEHLKRDLSKAEANQ